MDHVIKIQVFKDANEGVMIMHSKEGRSEVILVPQELWSAFVSAVEDVELGTPKTVSIFTLGDYENDEE